MFQGYVYGMKSWKELITAQVDLIDDGTYRVILTVEGVELGVLYFERAKKGWSNKPIVGGWTCVDAKIEGLYVYGGESVTPKELIEWCKELINASLIK